MQGRKRTFDLPRLAGEAVAIFIGVAAALAGQAWFEGRIERIEEREFLEAVLEDVVMLEARAEGLLELFESRRKVAVSVAYLIAQPQTPSTADSIARLAPQLSKYVTGDLLDPHAELLSAEALAVVKNASVRSDLANLRVQILDAKQVLNQNRDYVLTEWRAFGLQHFNHRWPEGWWSEEPEAAPDSPHDRGGAAMADSPLFENLIDLQITQYRNILRRVEVLRAEAVGLRSAVDDRLAAL